jgi:hypothetical protein
MLGHDLVGVIHIARFEDADAAKLFLGFDEGTVRGGDFAVFPTDGQGGFGGLEGFADGPVSAGAKIVVVFETFVEHRLFLGLSHGVVFAFVVVAQTDVFHLSSPVFFLLCMRASCPAAGLLSLFDVVKRNAS